MKGFKLLIALMSVFFFNSAWALITQIDPTIFENELRGAGIRHVAKVLTDLGIEKNAEKPATLVIKHVITTGRTQADRNFIILSIADLEKISPKISASAIMSPRAVSLSNEQIESVMHITKVDDDAGKWMMDKKKKKFIQIVLQKQDSEDNKISPVSKGEAKSLIKWAIKNKHLDEKDHDATAMKT